MKLMSTIRFLAYVQVVAKVASYGVVLFKKTGCFGKIWHDDVWISCVGTNDLGVSGCRSGL
jgi:hypothetical protein